MIIQPRSNPMLGLQVQKLIRVFSLRPPQTNAFNAQILLVAIAFITLAVGSTTYFSYRYVRRLILESLQKNALLTVQQSADEIDGWLATRKAEIGAIANSATVRTLDEGQIAPYLNAEQERLTDFAALALVTPQGLLSPTPQEFQNKLDDWEQVTQQQPTKDSSVSPVGSDRFAISSSVRANDPAVTLPVGQVTGLVGVEPIIRILDSLSYEQDDYAFALNERGLPLMRRQIPELESLLRGNSEQLRPLAAQMIRQDRGIEPLQIGDRRYSLVYVSLRRADWLIALAIPQKQLEARLGGLNFLAIAIGALLLALAVAAFRLVLTSARMRDLAAQEALLNRLTGRIRASLEVEEIIQTTVEEVAKLLDLEVAAFGWYDPHKLSVESWWEYSRKPLSGRHCGLELRSSLETQLQSTQSPQNAQQRLFIPVPTQDDSQGYLALVKASPWRPTTSEKELLKGVAGQLAIAITQSQLYVQTQQQVKRLAQALERSALVAITDDQGTISHVNEAFCQLSQYAREDLIGQDYRIFKFRDRAPNLFRDLYATLAQGQVWKGELYLCGKKGQDYWLDTTIFPFLAAKGISPQYLAVFFDITQRKDAEEQLRHAAFYDKLTGLPNRTLLMKRLETALQQADSQFALLFLDLDRFKILNDSLGHLIGDRLLVEVARRLQTCLRPQDTVTRFGGDEFIVLLENIDSVDDVTGIAQAIQTSLKTPYNLAGYEVFTSASIGIALSDRGYRNPEEVMRDADLAMYRAKAQHRGGYAVFDRQMHDEALNLLQLERDLRQALVRDGEFSLHYQPIICLQTGRIIGFEALVRWQHPTRGRISPELFIPIAEETQLITLLGEWVLREACEQLCQWQQQLPNLPHLRLNVNLSGVQLAQADLMERIDIILSTTGLTGHSLKLEITESVMMENLDVAKTWFEQLRRRHIQLSIDDFGTGYSSLSYLSSLPIDTLKIDRSFIDRMNRDRENLKIIEAIVALARNLRMDVVAEGVETEAQLVQLQALGCEYGQGYYFSQPLSCEQATALLVRTFGNNK